MSSVQTITESVTATWTAPSPVLIADPTFRKARHSAATSMLDLGEGNQPDGGEVVVLAWAHRGERDWCRSGLSRCRCQPPPIGYQHRRRHRPGDAPHTAGMACSTSRCSPPSMSTMARTYPYGTGCRPLAFWLLPSAIGIPVTVHALRRARRDLTAGANSDRPAGGKSFLKERGRSSPAFGRVDRSLVFSAVLGARRAEGSGSRVGCRPTA